MYVGLFFAFAHAGTVGSVSCVKYAGISVMSDTVCVCPVSALPSSAVCVAVDIGLSISAVLSTLPSPISFAVYVGFSDSLAQSDISSDFRYADRSTDIVPLSDTLIFSPIITPPSVSAVAGDKV